MALDSIIGRFRGPRKETSRRLASVDPIQLLLSPPPPVSSKTVTRRYVNIPK